MRKFTFVLMAALAFGCDDDEIDVDVDNDGIPDDIDDDIEEGIEDATEWRANITGTGLYSALAGNALVRQTINQQNFSVTIMLRNDTPGAVRPWHVHFGNCASGGAIVGPDTAYARLTIDGAGQASGSARVDVALDPNAAYHVNVHESDAAFTNIIGCGNLVRL